MIDRPDRYLEIPPFNSMQWIHKRGLTDEECEKAFEPFNSMQWILWVDC